MAPAPPLAPPSPTSRSPRSPLSSGTLILSMTGAITNMVLTLPLGPEQLEVRWPPRQTITQTIGGAWADHFGRGLGSMTISGQTGWKNPQRKGSLNTDLLADGFAVGQALYQFTQNYHDSCLAVPDPNAVQVIVQLTTDAQSFSGSLPDTNQQWTVMPGELRTTRSSSSPLVTRYELPCVITGDALGSSASQDATRARLTQTVASAFTLSSSVRLLTTGGDRTQAVTDLTPHGVQEAARQLYGVSLWDSLTSSQQATVYQAILSASGVSGDAGLAALAQHRGTYTFTFPALAL